MSKLTLIVLIVAAVNSCNQQPQQQAEIKCPDMMCTRIFASVPISFVNSSGQPAAMKYYKAVNLRTGEDITKPNSKSGSTFTVADDSDLKKLTEAGDDIQVSASDSISNKAVIDTIKVSGGRCACHVARVSGPEQIVIK